MKDLYHTTLILCFEVSSSLRSSHSMRLTPPFIRLRLVTSYLPSDLRFVGRHRYLWTSSRNPRDP